MDTMTGYKVTHTSSRTVYFAEIYRSGSHGLGVEFDQWRFAPEEDEFPTLMSRSVTKPKDFLRIYY